MSSLALDVFERLIHQVIEVEAAAARCEEDGFADQAPVLRRSGFVLAVASIDTFFHEHVATLLAGAAARSSGEAGAVANFCKSVSAADVAGPSGESHVRLRLSYKTLVAPRSIDSALLAAGLEPERIWRETAFALGARPERLRLQLELLYDRRNQIAHEGDWDRVQLDFRDMRQSHLSDCVDYLISLARSMDPHL